MMRAAIPSFAKRLYLLLFFLLTALTSVSCGGGSESPLSYVNTMTEMIPFIEQQMKDYEVAGLAIALVDDQRVVWARGFGYADAGKKIPATGKTLFEIGSISKTITASLIMQLAETGQLNIDDPVTRYLPDFSIGQPLGSFPSPGGPITIRSMMNHHAGIPGDLLNGAFTGSVKYPDYNTRLISYLAGEYADYPVDFLLAYSNTAVSLLSDVVTAASGQSFRERSRQFFTDLGMDHSTFYRESASVPANQSRGYILGQEYGPFYCNIEPSGSILSSASDMAKYLKMVMADGRGERKRVLAGETLGTMLTRTNSAVPLDYASIGLGWYVSDPDLAYAGRLCWHNGGTILMRSHMEILLDHKLAVIVMTNSMTGAVLAENAAKMVLKLAVEEKTGIRPPDPIVPQPSPIVTWTDAQLDAVAGIYVTASGYDLIKRVAGGLEWTSGAGLPALQIIAPAVKVPWLSNGPTAWESRAGIADRAIVRELVPRANGWFSLRETQQSQCEFKNVAGRRVMIIHGSLWSGLLGERYIPPAAMPASWTARLGTYNLVNLDADDASRYLPEAFQLLSSGMELKVKDGLLIMELTKGLQTGLQYVVHPGTDRLGYVRGLSRNLGGSVQIINTPAGEQIQFLGLRYAKQ
ncbi:MAG: beta-lactamase family protein [Deltaproteobacteria bacterium]